MLAVNFQGCGGVPAIEKKSVGQIRLKVLVMWFAGCVGVPTIEKKTVGKMGLKGVPGLNIASADGAQNGRQFQQRVRLVTEEPCCDNCLTVHKVHCMPILCSHAVVLGSYQCAAGGPQARSCRCRPPLSQHAAQHVAEAHC